MDNWNAPQWTDFTSSPQLLCDDYFDQEHKEHEPQPLDKVNAKSLLGVTESKTNLLTISCNDSELESELNIIKSTPVKVISPTSRHKGKTVKETTCDNVILQAMNNLQLSTKKKLRMPSYACSVSSDSKAMSTKRISRSMNSHIISNSIPTRSEKMRMRQSVLSTPQMLVSSTKTYEKSEKLSSVKVLIDNCQKIKDEKSSSNSLTEIIDDSKHTSINVNENTANHNHEVQHESENIIESSIKNETTEENASNNVDMIQKSESSDEIKSKVVLTFDKCKENMPAIRKSLSSKNQPRFSTSQFRRHSLMKYRRQSNQYISFAEAVLKFQSGTPKRFRTMSKKGLKPSSLAKARQSTLKPTQAVSPTLQSKLRTRKVTALSQEERERLEMEEIKKHPIKANPVRASTLKGPVLTKKIERKSLTIPEPFHLTGSKRSSQSSHRSSSQEQIINREQKREVLVPKVVYSNSDGITVKEVKIFNYGVPVRNEFKKIAQAVPFSFEIRNKEFQKKKEEKLKQLQVEEKKKVKADFHARPVPVFKKPVTSVTKEINVPKPKTKPCPFSFEERDKRLAKKKEELVKHVLEEDKKARKFHANPVPEFKPVIIRGRSKENINLNDKGTGEQKSRMSRSIIPKDSTKSTLNTKKHILNKENKAVNIKASSMDDLRPQSKASNLHKESRVLTELNTDKRARERKEFDDKIKQKEMQKEELRRKEEKEKLEEEERKIAEMRKMAEVKAKPMPVYKPLNIAQSDKPLTEPQSPAWNKFKK